MKSMSSKNTERKFHFEPNLDYQLQAIEAVCDLFAGQETCRTDFTVTKNPVQSEFLSGIDGNLDPINRLLLSDEQLLKNLNTVQLRNELLPSEKLISGNFTVEMETGTGKTYVYLRTIFELNKRYGFSKFAIVVPSIAIKEGVYKSLQITEDHLRSLYANVPFDYFLYDSSKLGQVRNFASSQHIQIMVMTVGAINKADVNNLYKDSEKTGGSRPVDLIKSTRPIVIVDEPQSVEGGLNGSGKAALDAMSPLCTLRYSATPANTYHMVFKLDAVDAYERKLVKQIEVASATIEGEHNKPYVCLMSVNRHGNVFSARVEIDVETNTGVHRREIEVETDDKLEGKANRAIYHDCVIGEIRVKKGKEYVELQLPGGESHYLALGETYGDVEPLIVQREMIRRTIKEHFDKEKRLRPQGIKVLSLFFIDSVRKYREYDADGKQIKGEYARIFEAEYKRLAGHPDYRELFQGVDLDRAAEEAHNGYFSIDKKERWTDTSENNESSRENAERAYGLIMKDKETLLSFDTPLKFIFSHSALREGWDNPNIFQICTLRDMRSERERRQTIGRGLRLCVNQNLERQHGFDLNTLTVIATESYEEFAENLQKEIEEETGIRFGVVEKQQFAAIPVTAENGRTAALGLEQSNALWNYLLSADYVNADGKIQDTLKQTLKNGTFSVPAQFAFQSDAIKGILLKLSGKLTIRNADERKTVHAREAILDGKEFKELWGRIKFKTSYGVEFNTEKLITDCIEGLRAAPSIAKAQLKWRKADIAIGKAGVDATEVAEDEPVILSESDIELPDLLTDLQDKTQLTRKSIVRILTESGRLNDFKRNPQQFIETAAEAINRSKRLVLVSGIKYERLGDDCFYSQMLFKDKELTGYFRNMVQNAIKSVYEDVVCDSDVERTFVDHLEKNTAVKVYAKLPDWFRIPTPLGNYTPDWALLVDTDEGERVYFVVETKSTLYLDALREQERAKITCGRSHFEALRTGDNPAKFRVKTTLDDVLASVVDETGEYEVNREPSPR